MAAQMNGRAKKPKKPEANGYANGHANGHLNGHADPTKKNSQPARPSSPSKKKGGFITSLFSIATRLLSWYLIITMAFRCPPSIAKISETSPAICKPYLNLRSYAAPYVDPYYQSYLAPQVEKVQPYVDRFNEQVYSPVATFTKDKYGAYGAPRVEQGKAYLHKAIEPQLEAAKSKARAQYDLHLAPHVDRASSLVVPYYEQGKETATTLYHDRVFPAYEAALPYAQTAYAHGHHVTAHIIFPHVRTAKDATLLFLTRTVWPHVRVLYGDNVEPQLVRIRERLGRHRDEKKLEAVLTEVEKSETATTTESASDDLFSAIWSSETQTAEQLSETGGSVATAKPSQPALSPEELREKLQNDLRTWQAKFAAAADKGSEDLQDRVGEITSRQVENQVKGHGAALLVQLEETVKSRTENFKDFIKKTVEKIPEDATEEQLELAYEQCIATSRDAGLAVKEKAQAIRNWKIKYDQETDDLVRSATESTLAVLDRIHDLGLQEVGMRWAWTDGVTYKDWKKYHELKNTLEEWRNEVEAVGGRHEGLRVAHEESANLENKAMGAAEQVAKELMRLKDVARWKIYAGDATDDFSNRKVPARAFKAAQGAVKNVEEAASKASDSIIGSQTPATESIASSVKDQVVDASSKASGSLADAQSSASKAAESVVSAAKFKKDQAQEAIVGTPAAKEPMLSKASASLESAAPKARSKVPLGAMAQKVESKGPILDDAIDDSDEATYSEKLQSMVSDAGDRAAELTAIVSEALLGPTSTQGSVESVTSLASQQYERALSAASSVIYGTKQGTVESASSVAASRYAEAVTAASYAIYGTPTPVLESLRAQASSSYDDAVSRAQGQYSAAKASVSKAVSGTPKPAHEEMLSSIESAYSGSLSAASEKLQDALQYTKTISVYAAGSTQGPLESISSIAASRLSDGLSLASAQYTSAKIAVGAQPTPVHQQYLADAQRRYYEGIGLAHARYSEFLGAASTAVYGTPTPVYQGAFNAAQSSYQSALNAAQLQYSNGVAAASSSLSSLRSAASSAAGQTSKSPAQSVLDSASSQYDAAITAASSSLAAASSKVSEALYGTQQGKAESIASAVSESAASIASEASSTVIGSETPWTQSVASQASQNWDALVARASEQVYGQPTPWAESVYSQAGAYGAQATEAAAAQYAAMQAVVSELVVGKEPDFTESVMNRFSMAYHTGYAASASSYAADAYASASSVVTSMFTPPPAIENILDSANAQLNSAIDAASAQVYGTSKGTVEQASESAASAYSSVSSKASEAIYGTQPSYGQQAQQSLSDVAASAQSAINAALYGTSTGTYESLTSAAASAYSSISSVASESAESAKAQASSAIYGPEQGAMDSASSRLAVAVESARARIVELYGDASHAGGEAVEQAQSNIENIASSISSAATAATQRVRDEL